MKYVGISNDGNYVFMNEGFYHLENGESKFHKYNQNVFKYLSEMFKSNIEFEFKTGVISLQEKLTSSKKFLNIILESYDFTYNDKLNYIIEWDKRFEGVYLINENTSSLIVETVLNESWEFVNTLTEGIWDSIKSGASKVWGGIKKAGNIVLQKVIMPIIKKGIIPFLRWIRRNLTTYFGIIAELILSMFPTVIVVKAVWGLIVMLDFYEIINNDFDPQDPDRGQMPFVFLIGDILSLAFTAGVGKVANKSLTTAAKTGAKSPAVKNILTKLLKSIPGLKNLLSSANKFLTKMFPTMTGLIRTIFNGIDTVITKLYSWITKIFGLNIGKQSVKKAITKTGQVILTKGGGYKLAIGLGLGVGLAELFEEESIGEGAKGKEVEQIQKSIEMIKTAPTNMGGIPNLKYDGGITGVYDSKTTQAIKDIQTNYKLPVTGKVDPKLGFAFGVEFKPGIMNTLITNVVGTENMEKFAKKLSSADNYLKNIFTPVKDKFNKKQ
jgi:hypothetical protein